MSDTSPTLDTLLRRLAPHIEGLATPCPCWQPQGNNLAGPYYACFACVGYRNLDKIHHKGCKCGGSGTLLPPLAEAAMKCLAWIINKELEPPWVTDIRIVHNGNGWYMGLARPERVDRYAPTLTEAVVRAAARVAGVEETS